MCIKSVRKRDWAYVPGHEDRPEKNAEHETIVLEVYVIHNQEAWMEEQRRGDNPLHGWVSRATNEPV